MYTDFERQDTFSEQPKHYTPDEQAAMCVLQYLNKDELSDFSNNPEKLNSYIADLDQVWFDSNLVFFLYAVLF